MLNRTLALPLHRAVHLGGPILLQGPRGSGKTTLLRREYPAHTYVTLNDAADRARARADPSVFLDRLRGPAIVDDLHRAPELIARLAGEAESRQFLFATSRRLRLSMETLELHAPTRAEMLRRPSMSLEMLGRFPSAPATATAAAPPWPRSDRFLEVDVRDLVKVHDLDRFEAFLAAARGQCNSLLDQQALADACGVAHRTAVRWLEVLHLCFLTIRLPPAEAAFGRRLTRSPKFHFLQAGPFVSQVISEIYRNACHAGETPDLRYWRDSNGLEIPLVLDGVPVVIAATPTPAEAARLRRWMELAGVRHGALIGAKQTAGRGGGIQSYSIDQL